jgi:hypothetical protein
VWAAYDRLYVLFPQIRIQIPVCPLFCSESQSSIFSLVSCANVPVLLSVWLQFPILPTGIVVVSAVIAAVFRAMQLPWVRRV